VLKIYLIGCANLSSLCMHDTEVQQYSHISSSHVMAL